MAKVEEVISAVEGMTVLELADLVKKLEEKFGVTAAAPAVVAAAAPAAAGQAEAVKEEFDVILASAGDKKIQVLKVLRELTGLGLKEKVKKEEAEEIKKKLEAEGAKVEIK